MCLHPCFNREEAKRRLQTFPHSPRITSLDAAAAVVVATASQLPTRCSSAGARRSAVSSQLVVGPWMFLDDGQSVVSLSEAVMISHVIRFGPMGSGQLLVV
jgi:hypothetical protein